MKIRLIICLLISFFSFSYSIEQPIVENINMESKIEKPTFLFKILTLESWEKSEREKILFLLPEDNQFIHLAKEEQLEKIIDKFFSDVKKIVVLKIDVSKMQGNLVFEINPGGSTKYYHLYDGLIPFDAIVEIRFLDK